jgi:KDO2-lipid IV(A) lauroyltransferase
LAASRKAINNIKSAMPELTDDEANKIVTGMWDNLGRVMMEYPHLEHIGRDRTEIFGRSALESYRGKPVIFISGHLGNWECCPPAMLLQLNYKNHPVYRAPNNPFSDWLLKRARTLKGELSAVPKSKSGTRHLVKILKNNQGIGMLIDQKYNEGIAADFMGRPAMTSPIFGQLAQKFDCPLVPLQIERLGNTPNFRITVHDPIPTKDRPVEDIVADSHDILEKWIKKHPAQWLWLHRRWDSNHLKGKTNEQA